MVKEDCRSCRCHKYWGKNEKCKWYHANLKYKEDGTVLIHRKFESKLNGGFFRSWMFVPDPCPMRTLLVH